MNEFSENYMLTRMKEFCQDLSNCELHQKVRILNAMREHLHDVSPFKNEPVDFVKWVNTDEVYANDYNPNSVAPPEMELLKLSIEADGYTQPIVTMSTDKGCEVVDGFHRTRVSKESDEIRGRIFGYAPVVTIKESQTDKGDRIASTIRHNRARGKHKIDSMSEIVVDLKKRNWSDAKIGKQLGMDADEVLRLTQISGLAEMFADREYSQSWEIEQQEEPIEQIL